jgi:hypothetical protein
MIAMYLGCRLRFTFIAASCTGCGVRLNGTAVTEALEHSRKLLPQLPHTPQQEVPRPKCSVTTAAL